MTDHLAESPAPVWWTAPGATDTFSYVGLVFFLFLVLCVIHLYARFDRFAEHRSAETPLRTTVPTLLMIALAYEVFPPLSHFSMLLPLALIAAAAARDFMLWSHAAEDRAGHDAVPGGDPGGRTAEPKEEGAQHNASRPDSDRSKHDAHALRDGGQK